MLGTEARTFIVSTPNRKNNFYWELLSANNENKDIELICERISKGEAEPFQYWVDSGGWGKCCLHWKAHPNYGRNPNFLQEIHEKQKLSWETIKQEYDLNFEESAESVFAADIVRRGAVGALEETRDATATYYAGLDTSTTGSDYTVAIILKEAADGVYSVVAMYRKRQQTSEYHLYQIGELIERYRPYTVGVEVTGGVGQLYLESLGRQYKNTRFEAIRTSRDSKPAMIAGLQLALEKEELRYPSGGAVGSSLREELLSFRRQAGKLEASQGRHDDIVLALSFALSVSPFALGRSPRLNLNNLFVGD